MVRLGGVDSAGGEVLPASRVVLAVGHSSRAMYTALLAGGVALTPKPFALGFRVEHPQALIDTIQYGKEYAAGGSLTHDCMLLRGHMMLRLKLGRWRASTLAEQVLCFHALLYTLTELQDVLNIVSIC